MLRTTWETLHSDFDILILFFFFYIKVIFLFFKKNKKKQHNPNFSKLNGQSVITKLDFSQIKWSSLKLKPKNTLSQIHI